MSLEQSAAVPFLLALETTAFVYFDHCCWNTKTDPDSLSYFCSVDDVYAVTDKLEKAGCEFQKKPDEGKGDQ